MKKVLLYLKNVLMVDLALFLAGIIIFVMLGSFIERGIFGGTYFDSFKYGFSVFVRAFVDFHINWRYVTFLLLLSFLSYIYDSKSSKKYF